ncbi:hypothetical protein CSW58_03840 [Caulobacter sp. B11]|uniref:hypothetical protein n=1 Tax=Caulobacter sp. B11 TaxID=2048899 RepID=UPI000C12CCFC|nr:hypothetical protein [Caulobacter sp. B11]PHY13726.1 hypothetical protein CSW58_03840 [Caulobacter sp. B11]
MISLVFVLLWGAHIAVVALAWWRGGAAERLAASLVITSTIVAKLIYMGLSEASQTLPLLAVDGGLALGFLILSLRFVKSWLGIAMVLEGVQFSLHAYFLVADQPHDMIYAAVNNVVTGGVLICLLVGTIQHWRRRAALAAR